MTQTTHLPEIEESAKFLGSLYGAEITAQDATEFDAGQIAVFANYTSDNEGSKHFIACDLEVAAILGAALTGFPPSHVEEAKKEGKLQENLLGNLEEVLNICVNLFPQSRNQRIVLGEVSVEDKAVAAFGECQDTATLKVKIDFPRYGTGHLVIGAS